MVSRWRILAALTVGLVFCGTNGWAQAVQGTVPTGLQMPAPAAPAAADPSLRTCPSDDFVLGRTQLPPNARPLVRLDPSTLAQPRGGKVKLIISDWPTPVFQNSFTVCFRWRSSGLPNPEILSTPVPVRIDSITGREVTVSAIVPDLPMAHTRAWAILASLGLTHDPAIDADPRSRTMSNLVPIADVLVRINDDNNNHLDAVVGVGITSQGFAVFVTLGLLALALGSLLRLRKFRNQDLSSVNLVLRLIAGSNGRASLSQFQIMLWSLVVGGGTIYVMMLTGGLIEISAGTLVLLGISGAATLGSQLGKAPDQPGGTGGTGGPASFGGAVAGQVVVAAATAAVAAPPAQRLPKWSDMVLSADCGEIDVTRAQMLFFTVITALFVTLKIITGYAIPEIPDSFQVLMGISNGVYVSKKFI